ncbi:MAG: hypothetical protein MJ200_04795, partial [Mycoplasmoidaceae bacterium]|nr:hypothetical protein [Mycoplasmoidaceae bacterium]
SVLACSAFILATTSVKSSNEVPLDEILKPELAKESIPSTPVSLPLGIPSKNASYLFLSF